MKNKNQKLINAVNKVSPILDEELKKIGGAGLCSIAVRRGYELLKREGVSNVQIAQGNCAISVNRREYGIISFGDICTETYGGGNVDGHYWLEVDDRIIDFSLLTLKETVKAIDASSGIKTGAIKLKVKPLVSKSLIKPLEQLRDGCLLGLFYQKKGCGYSYAFGEDVDYVLAVNGMSSANDSYYSNRDNCA